MRVEKTGLPFDSKPRLLALSVAAFSDLEKVSTTFAFNPTPAAPSLGVTLTTVGAAVSPPAPVVNELENDKPSVKDIVEAIKKSLPKEK